MLAAVRLADANDMGSARAAERTDRPSFLWLADTDHDTSGAASGKSGPDDPCDPATSREISDEDMGWFFGTTISTLILAWLVMRHKKPAS